MNGWLPDLEQVRLADYLDVAIVAVMIYLVGKWVWRETSRTAALVLLGSLGLYAAARLLGMYLTLAFFQVGLSVILIGLVVIFQQDLRHWFENVSQLWRFRRHKRADEGTLSPLIEGVGLLARGRVGALVVIQGRQHVGPFTRGGIPLQGRVSVPLVQSLFSTETPGHDGAVVIEGDWIERFAVHLPLSKNLEGSRPGGTRHAAALGLSECCDALVIVVSEERGTVSVAERGRLDVVDFPAGLVGRIDAFHADRFPSPGRRNSLARAARKTALKAAALGAACLLWFFFVHRGDEVQRTFEDVPVEFRNLPEDWMITESSPAKLTVTLAGPDQAFDALDPDSLRAALDVSNPEEKTTEIPITERHLGLPPGLRMVPKSDADPPLTVRFRAVEVVPVTVPVEVKTTGEPAQGFRVVGKQAFPQEVSLRVPRRSQDEVRSIPTRPVSLYCMERSVVEDKQLDLGGLPPVWFTDGQSPLVRVVVKIERGSPPTPKNGQ